MPRVKKKQIQVREYGDFTIDEIITEFTKLNELSMTNLDLGPIEIMTQSFHIISEQLELIEEMKRRTGLNNRELNSLFPKIDKSQWLPRQ